MGRSLEDESTRVAMGPPPEDEDLGLLVLSGPARGRYYRVPRKGGEVGREAESALRFDDPGISRQHCRFFRNDRGYFEVEDLGSRFGTFVEGQRTERQVVLDGDRIQVSAETVCRVRYLDGREPESLERPRGERIRDPLTGLYNRRYLLDRLEQEYAFARRHHAPLSILMLDLDHFQRINAEHGRAAGDRVLRAFARILHGAVRTEDLLARIGGDELVVVTREADATMSQVFAERLRQLVRSRPFAVEDHTTQITASVGVTTYAKGRAASMMELLVEADAALHEAKRHGRDRVELFAPAPEEDAP